MSKSAARTIRMLSRTYPLLVELVKQSNEFWTVPGLFRDADAIEPAELYQAVPKRIKSHGLSYPDAAVPPLSDELMKRLVGRKHPFPDLGEQDEYVFDVALALGLAAKLPAQWFPETQSGLENLSECGRHAHYLEHQYGFSLNSILVNALRGDGMGLELSDEDLCTMFRTSGQTCFQHSLHDAYIARRGKIENLLFSSTEALAVYGVRLAGREAEFEKWQLRGVHQQRRYKRWSNWDWCYDDVPEVLAGLVFAELVSIMKCDGYVDTYAKAATYCNALKTRLVQATSKVT